MSTRILEGKNFSFTKRVLQATLWRRYSLFVLLTIRIYTDLLR